MAEENIQDTLDASQFRTADVEPELGLAAPDPGEDDNAGFFAGTREVSYLQELHYHPQFSKQALHDAIRSQLSVHQHFVSKDSFYDTGLPVFDDCRIYGFSRELEEKSHEKQLTILMHCFEQGAEIERPHLLNPDDAPNSHSDIAAIAELISCNLDICLYDSASDTLGHLFPHQEETTSAEWLVEMASNVAKASSKVLKEKYVASSGGQPKPSIALKDEMLSQRCYPALIDYVCCSIVRLMSRSISGSSCLISFIAILVRLSTKLKYLVDKDPRQCARQSLSNGRSIISRLESAGAESRWQREKSYNKARFTIIDSGPMHSASSRYSGAGLRRLIEYSTPPTRYYKMQFIVRIQFTNMMRALLGALVSTSAPDGRISAQSRVQPGVSNLLFPRENENDDRAHFGFANVIHGNGIERPFLFSNDRKQKTSTSLRELDLCLASHACTLAIANFEAIQAESNCLDVAESSQDDSVPCVPPKLARIAWTQTIPSLELARDEGDSERYSEANGESTSIGPQLREKTPSDSVRVPHLKREHCEVAKAEHYISALVSCALASTSVVSPLRYCINIMRQNAGPGEHIYGTAFNPKLDFSLACASSITTGDTITRSDFIPIDQAHSVWQSLPVKRLPYQSTLRRRPRWRQLFLRLRLKRSDHYLDPSDVEQGVHTFASGQKKIENAYNRDLPTMSKCHIGITAITVSCRAFVLFVGLSFLSIIILAVGLVIGLHGQVAGVDMSNMALLIWTIATAGLLLAKSWFVHDWPWHDFLQGQVVCHSVSETCRITGVSDQSLLMFLLRDERAKHLRTSGPWNGLFDAGKPRSKSSTTEHDGFSIDRGSKLATVTQCGIMVLKAVHEDGECLICVGGNRASPSLGFNYGVRQKCLMAKLPSSTGSGGTTAVSAHDTGRSPLLFNQESFGLGKIFGFYQDDNVLLG